MRRNQVLLVLAAFFAATLWLDEAQAQLACGDCDGNSFVDILDALQAARHGAGLTVIVPPNFDACNVVRLSEGQVTILDALEIARHVVGLVPVLMCLPPSPPQGTKLYVNTGGAVEVVDMATNMSVGTIPFTGIGQGIDRDASGDFVYASAGGNLYEIDTASDMISRTMPLTTTNARKVAVSGANAYVAQFSATGTSSIDRVDLLSTVVANLGLVLGAWEVTANRAGTQIYTGHIGNGDLVTRVDVASYSIGTSSAAFDNPIAIEENPVTGLLYVACRDNNPDMSGPNDLQIRDPMTLLSVGAFAIDDAFGLAVLPDGSALYTASNHQVGAPLPPYFARKVDLISGTVLPTMIPIGSQPWYFAVDLIGASVFTCDNASNQISRINTSTDTVSATIMLSAAPRDAVVK